MDDVLFSLYRAIYNLEQKCIQQLTHSFICSFKKNDKNGKPYVCGENSKHQEEKCKADKEELSCNFFPLDIRKRDHSCRESGRLTAHLYFSLSNSQSNLPVSSPALQQTIIYVNFCPCPISSGSHRSSYPNIPPQTHRPQFQQPLPGNPQANLTRKFHP